MSTHVSFPSLRVLPASMTRGERTCEEAGLVLGVLELVRVRLELFASSLLGRVCGLVGHGLPRGPNVGASGEAGCASTQSGDVGRRSLHLELEGDEHESAAEGTNDRPRPRLTNAYLSPCRRCAFDRAGSAEAERQWRRATPRARGQGTHHLYNSASCGTGTRAKRSGVNLELPATKFKMRRAGRHSESAQVAAACNHPSSFKKMGSSA